MRKWIVLFVVMSASGLFMGAMKDTPPRGQQAIEIRSQTSNDLTMLDNDTKDWKTCKANFIDIPPDWRRIGVSIYAYDANNTPDSNTGTIYIYGCDYYGGARLLGYGNFTMGAVQMSHNPVTGAELNSGDVSSYYSWADTYLPLDAGIWVDDANDVRLQGAYKISGGGGEDPNGNITTLWFDRKTLAGIYADVNNVTFGNAGSDLTSVTVVMNGSD